MNNWFQGIFCANFAWSVGGWDPCWSTWCGRCYSSHHELKFYVTEEEQRLNKEEDVDRLAYQWGVKAKTITEKFHVARDGDHLMVSFECDKCIFRKLQKRDPCPEGQVDLLLMRSIRRMNLDAFWSRAEKTVSANTRVNRQTQKYSEDYGLLGTCVEPGLLPGDDHCGYEVALAMLAASREAGLYSLTHKQWDTIRSIKTAHSNQTRTSREASLYPIALESQEGKSYTRLSRDGTPSLWFNRFMQGCKNRMGQDVRTNLAMSLKLMLALLDQCTANAGQAKTNRMRFDWLITGGYFCICYVTSLRGNEGQMIDLGALFEFNKPDTKEVVIGLQGKIKGEHSSCQGNTGGNSAVKDRRRDL